MYIFVYKIISSWKVHQFQYKSLQQKKSINIVTSFYTKIKIYQSMIGWYFYASFEINQWNLLLLSIFDWFPRFILNVVAFTFVTFFLKIYSCLLFYVYTFVHKGNCLIKYTHAFFLFVIYFGVIYSLQNLKNMDAILYNFIINPFWMRQNWGVRAKKV